MTLRRAYLVALVVLVAAFVALHPYLGPADLCGPGRCPHGVEVHGAASIDPSAALAVVPALTSLALRRVASERLPNQTYLSPETPPPRSFSGR